MRNNFLGVSSFIWWVGVIENNLDPMELGRCQVRIFGWHTDNKSMLPMKDLPWAMPLRPVNNSRSFATPDLGEWAVGFFMDGESAQFPVMMGIMPGIKQ